MKPTRFLFVVTILAISVEKCLTENLTLLILHNNDMHSRFEESKDGFGGMARVAHVVREARKAAEEGKAPPTLFLNAGDTFTGTAWFNVHRWKIVSEFLNILEPNATSFGNHEFDDRIAGVTEFIKNATFPIVAANIDFSPEPTIAALNIPKSVILEVSGKKIGVIGYLTPETAIISSSEGLIFEHEVSAIQRESERLDADGVKIIIALGHSGYEMDQQIAREVPLVDLVIGGHTNTFLWNGLIPPDVEEIEGPYPTIVTQTNGKEVPVVQANAYTKYMGRLNITFDDNGDVLESIGQPLLLSKDIPQDQDVLDVLDRYRPEVEALDKEVVGHIRVVLDGEKTSCRSGECNFCNMIADAFVAYHSSVHGGDRWTDAPIGIINGGGVKVSIKSEKPDGSITRGQLLEAMPYQDQVWTMTLNGSDLLEALENGVRGNGETSGGELLQVSGIHYKYDKSRKVGSRIVQAKARCGTCSVPKYETIQPHMPYRIITTTFLNLGGDEHAMFKNKGYDKSVQDLIDIDTIVWYMEKFSPVYPAVEDRFFQVGDTEGSGGEGSGGEGSGGEGSGGEGSGGEGSGGEGSGGEGSGGEGSGGEGSGGEGSGGEGSGGEGSGGEGSGGEGSGGEGSGGEGSGGEGSGGEGSGGEGSGEGSGGGIGEGSGEGSGEEGGGGGGGGGSNKLASVFLIGLIALGLSVVR